MSDWERVTALFGAARQLDPETRRIFLNAIAEKAPSVRDEVEQLLADASRDDSFLAEPVWRPGALTTLIPSLEPGDLLKDRYCIVAAVASGGQALVYRATDTVLSRPVVVKVMRANAEHNQLLKSRFEHEMKALSRIDHPGVVGILDVGELADGRPFLVIQYVNGTSLREELQHGPIEPRRAARLLRELGSALSAAHAAGIAHRDVKPENIMIQRFDDGSETVRLIDFGISKVEQPGSRPALSALFVAGTVRYMAPEQFRGAHSPASDVFALSLVACEILCGYPDTRALSKATNPEVTRLLESALAFRPEDRPTDVRQLCERLANELTVGRRPRHARWWLAAAIVAALFAGGSAASRLWRSAASGESIRFALPLPEATSFPDGPGVLSLSPDGRRIAFAAVSGGASTLSGSRLWIRSLGSLTAEPVAAAGYGYQPFWSPDSRFLGFTDSVTGALKRIDPSGGPPLTLAERTDVGRGAWSKRGVILYTGFDGRLYRVPDSGGPATPVTTLDVSHREFAHLWPAFLPDGNRFIFLAYSSPADCTLYMASLDSPARTRIAAMVSTVEYADGYLFFQSQGTLMAQQFDGNAGRLEGDPRPLAPAIRVNRENGRSAFSVSATGVLAYASGARNDVTTLIWHDRQGRPGAMIGEAGEYAYPRMSPDGTRVAVNRRSGDGQWDVWIIRLDRNESIRLTFNDQSDYWPLVWSPDGGSLVFAARKKDKIAFDLYRRSIGAAEPDELLFESSDDKEPTGFSPDGRLLLFNRQVGPGQKMDIWALPLDGGRKPSAVINNPYPYNQHSGVFSPDGRWMAYTWTENGANQLYVQRFPPTSFKLQLSTEGANSPTWSQDGRRIFYSTLDSIWSTDVSLAGDALRAELPQRLFTRPFLGGGFGGFGIDRPAERFLLVVPAQPDPDLNSVKVVLNWRALLPRS